MRQLRFAIGQQRFRTARREAATHRRLQKRHVDLVNVLQLGQQVRVLDHLNAHADAPAVGRIANLAKEPRGGAGQLELVPREHFTHLLDRYQPIAPAAAAAAAVHQVHAREDAPAYLRERLIIFAPLLSLQVGDKIGRSTPQLRRLEQVNATPLMGCGKYEVSRLIETKVTAEAEPTLLIAA